MTEEEANVITKQMLCDVLGERLQLYRRIASKEGQDEKLVSQMEAKQYTILAVAQELGLNLV